MDACATSAASAASAASAVDDARAARSSRATGTTHKAPKLLVLGVALGPTCRAGGTYGHQRVLEAPAQGDQGLDGYHPGSTVAATAVEEHGHARLQADHHIGSNRCGDAICDHAVVRRW